MNEKCKRSCKQCEPPLDMENKCHNGTKSACEPDENGVTVIICQSQRCDGVIDCPKGEDESKCSGPYFDSCTDLSSYCSEWKSWCYLMPNWVQSCRKTCDVCEVPLEPEPCQDYHRKCYFWSTTGDCDKFAPWMHEHCKYSCKQCEPGQKINEVPEIDWERALQDSPIKFNG